MISGRRQTNNRGRRPWNGKPSTPSQLIAGVVSCHDETRRLRQGRVRAGGCDLTSRLAPQQQEPEAELWYGMDNGRGFGTIKTTWLDDGWARNDRNK